MEYVPFVQATVGTKTVRDHFGVDLEKFRFWIRAGLFPGQPMEGNVGQGLRRRYTFDDVLVARLIHDLQALTQGRSFELLKQLILDIRGMVESPMRGWTSVGHGARHAERWVVVTWAGSEYGVWTLGGIPWEALPGELKRHGIVSEGPFIIFALHEIEAQERAWFEDVIK